MSESEDLKKKQAMEELTCDDVYTIHRNARRKFKRRRIVSLHLNDLHQADLIDFTNYKKDNKGYAYILVVIDCLSRFVLCTPLKTKSGPDVRKGLIKLYRGRPTSHHLWVDLGREFYNKHVKDWCKKHRVNLFSTFTGLKACMAERVIRTLKGRLFRYFRSKGNHKFLGILPSIVRDYNSSYHSTIRMTPIDVNETNEVELFNRLNSKQDSSPKKIHFAIGDQVRVLTNRSIFDKGYTGHWSHIVYKISRIKKTDPVVYYISGPDGEEEKGCYYAPELQRVSKSDDGPYPIERIVARKNINGATHYKVKWYGYDSTYNSWIPARDIIRF